MVDRVDWHCPSCGRKYAIPATSMLPDLCPKCDPQEVGRRVPKKHVLNRKSDIPIAKPVENPTQNQSGFSGLKMLLAFLVFVLAICGALQFFGIEIQLGEMNDDHIASPNDNQSAKATQQEKETAQNSEPHESQSNTPVEKVTPAPKTLVELVKLIEPSVVRVNCDGGTGSGFLVRDRQTVVTNHHVIETARSVVVVFPDGESIRVLGTKGMDAKRDLAILHLEKPSSSKPLRLADDLPDKGADVITFGSPKNLSFSVSQGIVSGIRNTLELQIVFNNEWKGSWIQTTAPISPGNSGGPLVNFLGEVVGANTFQDTEGQNLNFAISSIDIHDLLEKSESSIASLAPATVPTVVERPRLPEIIDYTGTETSKELLQGIDQMTVRVAYSNSKNQSSFLTVIRGEIEAVLRSVGVTPIEDVIPGKPVLLCLIASRRTRMGGTSITLFVHILTKDITNGRPVLLSLYEHAHVLSTASRRQLDKSLEQFSRENKRRLAAIREVTTDDATDKLRLFDANERAKAKLALVKQFMDRGKTEIAIQWLREIRDPNKGFPGTEGATLAGAKLAAIPSVNAESEANRELKFAQYYVAAGQLEIGIWYYKEIVIHWPKTTAAKEAKQFLGSLKNNG